MGESAHTGMKASLDIKTLYSDLQDKLSLTWVSGTEHQDILLHGGDSESAETSMIGHLNLITPHRIQLVGRQELEYLDSLRKNSRKDTISQLLSGQSALVIMTQGLDAPEDLRQGAKSEQMPMLSSTASTEGVIEVITHYLSTSLAHNITLHGVFMEVMGTGVLIQGEASVGKSELALELLTRGHRLIADDAPEFTRTSPDTLLGRCPDMLRDFLEVRGLGILNVRAMFGDSAIKATRNLRLIIMLQDIGEAEQIDRLHGSRRMRTVQGVDVPEVTLPVGPGRNLAVLLEAAVRNHILQTKGYNASEAFIERQKQRLEQSYP